MFKKSKIVPTEAELLGDDDPVPDVDLSFMDRFQKTQWYAMNFVSNRVKDINEDEDYQKRKALCFVTSIVSLMIGLFLILFGLPATAIFSAFHRNWVAISFGILFSIPIFIWIRFMFFADILEQAARKRIIRKRKERMKPSLFDEILKESEQLSKPPATRIKIIARLRKKEYRVLAATWREFCLAIEEETGLPLKQQLIKFEHKNYDFESVLDKV